MKEPLQPRATIRLSTVLALAITTFVLSLPCCPQLKSEPKENPVFRAPFVLELRVNNSHDYRESFDRIPYVAENSV
jgi:hypothetical protein